MANWKNDTKLQKLHETILTDLAKQPGNDKCADCGGRFTRFASITIGVFLCNRCYGLHRKVGVHVTRTKCIGLDAWSPQEVEKMKQIGNSRANAYWEGNIPTGWQKVGPDSPNEAVEAWIRKKYEHRLFVNPSKDSPLVSLQGAPSSAEIWQESSTFSSGNVGKCPTSGHLVPETSLDDSLDWSSTYKNRTSHAPPLQLNLSNTQTCQISPAVDPFANLEEQFGNFQSAQKPCP